MLKSLNFSELEKSAECLKALVEGQVQDTLSNDSHFAFSVWKHGRLSWVWLDLRPSHPLVFVLEKPPRGFKKKPKPVQLFFKARFVGKRLQEVATDPGWGRVLKLGFSGDAALECRLFPGGQNLLLNIENKSVSWNKVRELPEAGEAKAWPMRDLRELQEQWLRTMQGAGSEQKSSQSLEQRVASEKKKLLKQIDKKQKAISNLDIETLNEEAESLALAGEWLKTAGANWSTSSEAGRFSFLNAQKSQSENLNWCFAESKKISAQAEKRLQKATHLREEIQKLEDVLADEKSLREHVLKSHTKRPAKKDNILSQAGAKGRTLHLKGGESASIGKSARDNLQLLRKAKAWYLWLHLKDLPGAFAIVQRDKKSGEISGSDVQKVARWLAAESRARFAFADGDRLEVLLAECRFVQPIKGDKLGRVTYRNEKAFSFTYKGP